MSDIPGTTRAQTKFLRAMSKNPSGPPPELWPSPSALRRWLRRPGFLKALQSVRETLFFQADIHLAYTANSAFQALKHALANLPSDPDLRKLQNATIHAASRLARISHPRQQNPAAPPFQPLNHAWATPPPAPDLRKLQTATIPAASRLARISHLRQQNPADPP